MAKDGDLVRHNIAIGPLAECAPSLQVHRAPHIVHMQRLTSSAARHLRRFAQAVLLLEAPVDGCSPSISLCLLDELVLCCTALLIEAQLELVVRPVLWALARLLPIANVTVKV